MKSEKAKLVVLIGLGLLGGTLARADEWNQRTEFTFSGPVEVPGQVLPSGTYIFELAASQSDRNIVQVFSKDEKRLYGTFLTIPDQRMRPVGKTIITFDERPIGSPEAIRSWFYPGQTYGHDFVYPKPKAVALAKANNTPVPSMPAALAENITKPTDSLDEPHVVAMSVAPLKAIKPTEEEVEIAEVFIAQQETAVQLPASLPKTGSPFPLIGFAGLLSLGLAGVLKLAAHL